MPATVKTCSDAYFDSNETEIIVFQIFTIILILLFFVSVAFKVCVS